LPEIREILFFVKKLHILILKSYLGPFVMTFFIVIFVLLMQFLWRYIDVLVGKGLEIPVLSELLLYTTASLVPMAVPLAVLLASLMAFGNLGENYELLALKSSGISLYRIMTPLIFFVTFITIGAFLFNNHAVPYANLKMRSLLYDIQKQNPEIQIKPGIFDNSIEGFSIRIEEKDPRTSLLKGIQIYDHTENLGNISVTIADSGYIKMTKDERNLIFTLYNGYSYTEMQRQKKSKREKSYPMRRDHFEVQEMIIELGNLGLQRSDESLFRSSYQMLNLSQLKSIQDSIKDELVTEQKSLTTIIRDGSYPKTKKIESPVSYADTTGPATERPGDIIPTFELFNQLDHSMRLSVISAAISMASNSRNYVNNNFFTTDTKIRRLRKYQIETHKKYTLSLACLVFFFIGAPLGAIIRKGGLGIPVVISVLFFILWYIISLSGEKFARESIVTPFTGVWLSTFVLIPLGALLTQKSTQESAVLNLETYTLFLNKIVAFFKRKKKPEWK
jgi:lipopolysaccharide export system permease protein